MNQQQLGLFLGLIGVVIFSGTVPATRLAVSELDPWFVTFARAAIAGSIAAMILLATRRTLPKAFWKFSTLSSLCLVIGFPGFLSLALLTVPASHSGVVLGLLPITTAIFSVLFADERPSISFWIWSTLGALLIIVFTLRDGAPGFEIGDLWLVAATLSASFGYVFSGKISRQKPGWEVICWQLIIAAPFIIAGTLWFWDDAIFTARPSTQLGFAYVSLFSMLIGFFAWNAGLALGGIARVGQLQLLQTFFTLAIAAVVLEETISSETLFFATAIVVVIWYARKARVSTSS
ncbi:MAG: DMT family transporter [Hyphomicrobiales bacterium]